MSTVGKDGAELPQSFESPLFDNDQLDKLVQQLENQLPGVWLLESLVSYLAKEGRTDLIRRLISIHQVNINGYLAKGLSPPVGAAIMGGHEETALYLLKDAGVDINREQRKDGLTILDLAAAAGMVNVVKCLVLEKDFKEKPSSDVDCHHLPLCYAVFNDHLETFTFFVNHYGVGIIREPCLVKASGDLILHAVSHDAVKILKWIMDNVGIDSNGSILHSAAVNGATRCCQLLLSDGKVPADILDDGRCSPLHAVCYRSPLDKVTHSSTEDQRLAIVEVFIAAGADIFLEDGEGLRPADFAEISGYHSICNLLNSYEKGVMSMIQAKSLDEFHHHYQMIEQRAPKFWQNSSIRRKNLVGALCHHAGEGRMDVVQHLVLDLKVDVNQHVDGGPIAALEWTIMNRHEELALWLIKEGKAQVDLKHLRQAGEFNLRGLIKYMLVDNPIELPRGKNRTRFAAVLVLGYVNVIDCYLQHFGRDCLKEPCTVEGFPPVMLAAGLLSSEVLEYLIHQADADPMARNGKGRTALHLAAALGRSQNIQILLACGRANVNVRCDRMTTPLHVACDTQLEEVNIKQDDRLAVVRILMEAGADRNAQDEDGRKPLHCARACNLNHIVEYLTREDREAAVSRQGNRKGIGIWRMLDVMCLLFCCL